MDYWSTDYKSHILFRLLGHMGLHDMFARTLFVLICCVAPLSVQAKGYRLVPSSTQRLDAIQQTEATIWSDSPTVVGEIDGVRLLVSPRPDFFQNPWIGISYIIDNRNNPNDAAEVNAASVRAYILDKEVKRYTQTEQLAYLDKRKRSADFWGGISAGLAAMNASRTAGRNDFRGTAQGTVINQYGNQAQVKTQYSGTIIDRDAAQRAGEDAAIERARATHATMQTMDAYSLQVLEYSPEQRAAMPGEESTKAYWVFDLPKAKRGTTPLRLEVDINDKHFVFNFDLIR